MSGQFRLSPVGLPAGPQAAVWQITASRARVQVDETVVVCQHNRWQMLPLGHGVHPCRFVAFDGRRTPMLRTLNEWCARWPGALPADMAVSVAVAGKGLSARVDRLGVAHRLVAVSWTENWSLRERARASFAAISAAAWAYDRAEWPAVVGN